VPATIGASVRAFLRDHFPVYPLRVTLSVVLITYNEEANLARTLESVRALVRDGQGEIIVVDSGSTDRTGEIAESFGAKVFVEAWKGYARQKNSAMEKAAGDWILSLDADEEVSPDLAAEILHILSHPPQVYKLMRRQADGTVAPVLINGCWMRRKNYFLGRWIRHGGFWPDRKLRLCRRGAGRFREASVHETMEVEEYRGGGVTVLSKNLRGVLIHHSYPTLSDYIEHMNRYSSLGAEMVVADGRTGFSVINIAIRPWVTFFYNYFLRLGFLDGREGLLLHLYHAVYVSWKYGKAWELERSRKA
jgi:glycosyltransferase involved in cell wall biosynthesis